MSNIPVCEVTVESEESSEHPQVFELGLLSCSVLPSFSEGGAHTVAVAAPSSEEDTIHIHLLGYFWCGISEGELPPSLLHPFVVLEGFSSTHESNPEMVCLACVLLLCGHIGVQCCHSTCYLCKGCEEAGLPCVSVSS